MDEAGHHSLFTAARRTAEQEVWYTILFEHYSPVETVALKYFFSKKSMVKKSEAMPTQRCVSTCNPPR
jgi:hypothetical protein